MWHNSPHFNVGILTHLLWRRANYYKRLFVPYFTQQKSQLSFWHGKPEVNPNMRTDEIGEFYQPFIYKANYNGHFDANGVPMLDYHGKVGMQYNPIAIAQYALGHYNLYKRTGDRKHLDIFIKEADWLVNNLVPNEKGVYVWYHHFDWEYREGLKAPWYSGLSQGNGLSVMVRAYQLTKDERYRIAAERVYISLITEIKDGGAMFTDINGDIWIEEGILDPPTHILNGFMWALWGIYDYYLFTKDENIKRTFDRFVITLKKNLPKFDVGIWSLYELVPTRIKMIASHFYHSLHVVQLMVMYKLTSDEFFLKYHKKWDVYQKNRIYRFLSLIWKAAFKLLHY